jgi:hypothetical protein
MKLKMIAAVVSTLAITNAYAQETYNVEAGFQYGKFSNDDGTKQKVTSVGGTYYLKPVAINQSQPFMELDFLQKASGISVLYATLGYEDKTFASTNANPLEVSGNFYVDNFAFGASTSSWGSTNFTTKANAARYVGIKSTDTGFNVGYFVTPTTLVSYVSSKGTATYSPSAGISAINDLNTTTNGVKSHTVMSLGGTESLVVDLAYSQIKQEQTASKKNTEYAAKVRYYPEAKYFVEGGYTSNSGDNAGAKGKTMLLGAGYSFTPRFAVLLSTEKFSGDMSAEKSSSSTTTLSAGYRF